jgi:repressor LexA
MIQITPQARNRFQGIPVVGRVAAGVPLLALENIEGFLKVDGDIAGDREVFFLRVKGESMIGYGIKDGDYVLVQPEKTASEGEIVVFRIHDEATVKEYRRKGELVLLVPHNPEFQIVECNADEDFEILGKVVGLWRKM